MGAVGGAAVEDHGRRRDDGAIVDLVVRQARVEEKLDNIEKAIADHSESDRQIQREMSDGIRRVHDRVDMILPQVNQAMEKKFSSLERAVSDAKESADRKIGSIMKASWAGVWVVLTFLVSTIGAVIVFFVSYHREINMVLERLGAH